MRGSPDNSGSIELNSDYLEEVSDKHFEYIKTSDTRLTTGTTQDIKVGNIVSVKCAEENSFGLFNSNSFNTLTSSYAYSSASYTKNALNGRHLYSEYNLYKIGVQQKKLEVVEDEYESAITKIMNNQQYYEKNCSQRVIDAQLVINNAKFEAETKKVPSAENRDKKATEQVS